MVSKYFSLDEVCKTNKGIENKPNSIQIVNIGFLCNSLLDKVREHFNAPLVCSSIFRSSALNEAIGGVRTSQHCANNGAAADITSCGNYSLLEIFEFVKDNLSFDQMILEDVADLKRPESMRWLHVSTKLKGNRKEILLMKGGKYYKY